MKWRPNEKAHTKKMTEKRKKTLEETTRNETRKRDKKITEKEKGRTRPRRIGGVMREKRLSKRCREDVRAFPGLDIATDSKATLCGEGEWGQSHVDT